MPMTHAQAQKWIRELAGGAPNPRAEGRLSEHLESCEPCQVYAVELARFESRLSGSLQDRWRRSTLSSFEVRQTVQAIEQQSRRRRQTENLHLLLRSVVAVGSAAIVVLALWWAIQSQAPWLQRLFPEPTLPPGAAGEQAAEPPPPFQDLPFLPDRPPASLQGQSLPESSEIISPENIARLAPLALWGQDNFQEMALSPDGAELAAVSRSTGRVYFYNAHTLKETGSIDLAPAQSCTSLDYAPEGARLAVGCRAALMIWSLPEKQRLHIITVLPVQAVAFSPDGKFLATAHANEIRLWDIPGMGNRPILMRGENRALAFSPDGALLASGGQDGGITLFRLADGQAVAAWTGHTSFTARLVFSPDGSLLASTGGDNDVKLWRVEDGSLYRDIQTDAWSMDLAFSPGGDRLIIGGYRPVIFQVKADEVSPLEWSGAPLSLAQNPVFDPTGKALLLRSGSTLYRLRASDGSLEAQSSQPLTRLTALAFSPDGQTVITGSADGAVRAWRLNDGDLLQNLTGHEDEITALDFSPDGAVLASGSLDGTMRIWNLDAGTGRESAGQINRRIVTGQRVRALAFSPDGQTLAIGGSAGKVDLWRIAGARKMNTFSIGMGDVTSLDFAPDGSLLAVGAGKSTLTLIDLAASAVLRQWQEGGEYHAGWIKGLRFTPDGSALAASFPDGQNTFIKLWRVSDGAVLRSFQQYTTGDSPLSFSQDGRLLVNGPWVYDVDTARVLAVLPNGGLETIFSGNGKQLLNLTPGGVWIWGIP